MGMYCHQPPSNILYIYFSRHLYFVSVYELASSIYKTLENTAICTGPQSSRDVIIIFRGQMPGAPTTIYPLNLVLPRVAGLAWSLKDQSAIL